MRSRSFPAICADRTDSPAAVASPALAIASRAARLTMYPLAPAAIYVNASLPHFVGTKPRGRPTGAWLTRTPHRPVLTTTSGPSGPYTAVPARCTFAEVCPRLGILSNRDANLEHWGGESGA